MPNNPYAKYQNETVSMASPAGLLVLMYDHLAMDLGRAEKAIEAKNIGESHTYLVHAQKIIAMLRSDLRVDLWEGAAALFSLYDYLHAELVRANLYKDVERVRNCMTLIEPLHRAWQAASQGANVRAGAA